MIARGQRRRLGINLKPKLPQVMKFVQKGSTAHADTIYVSSKAQFQDKRILTGALIISLSDADLLETELRVKLFCGFVRTPQLQKNLFYARLSGHINGFLKEAGCDAALPFADLYSEIGDVGFIRGRFHDDEAGDVSFDLRDEKVLILRTQNVSEKPFIPRVRERSPLYFEDLGDIRNLSLSYQQNVNYITEPAILK